MIIQPQCKPGGFKNKEGWLPQQAWPEDCTVQWGTAGIVFSQDGIYRTAFFEAFPKEPKTFIRGEGVDIIEAELDAYIQYRLYLNCPKHSYVRKGYKNGAGFCEHCGLFVSKCFEPLTNCKICNIPTDYSTDKENSFYCEEHYKFIPDELKFSWQLELEDLLDEEEE